MPTPVLLAEAVSRRYRNGRGVGPVSLRVEGGEVLALVGPNGSGKTTLVRCLGTRSPRQSGELLWFGKPDPRSARGRLGVVFDATAHVDELSGEENLQFFARVRGGARTQPLLRDAELTEVAGEPISSYSYGMRRRLLLAEALLGDPELLILDEPTLGLDVVGRRWLADTLAERRRRGLVAVVSTNDTEFVEAVATRVGFLIEGRLGVVFDATAHVDELSGEENLQ
ncbi:MAG: ABC transporter ATP-binding protein, partial [Candidatus Dormiibacterota bacterium]